MTYTVRKWEHLRILLRALYVYDAALHTPVQTPLEDAERQSVAFLIADIEMALKRAPRSSQEVK